MACPNDRRPDFAALQALAAALGEDARSAAGAEMDEAEAVARTARA